MDACKSGRPVKSSEAEMLPARRKGLRGLGWVLGKQEVNQLDVLLYPVS